MDEGHYSVTNRKYKNYGNFPATTNHSYLSNSNSNATDYSLLTSIGLSKMSAASYGILYESGLATVSEIAALTDKPYRSIYRNIADLVNRGFVVHIYTGHHPYCYQAIPIEDVLERYAMWQRAQVQPLIHAQELQYLTERLQLAWQQRQRKLGRR